MFKTLTSKPTYFIAATFQIHKFKIIICAQCIILNVTIRIKFIKNKILFYISVLQNLPQISVYSILGITTDGANYIQLQCLTRFQTAAFIFTHKYLRWVWRKCYPEVFIMHNVVWRRSDHSLTLNLYSHSHHHQHQLSRIRPSGSFQFRTMSELVVLIF